MDNKEFSTIAKRSANLFDALQSDNAQTSNEPPSLYPSQAYSGAGSQVQPTQPEYLPPVDTLPQSKLESKKDRLFGGLTPEEKQANYENYINDSQDGGLLNALKGGISAGESMYVAARSIPALAVGVGGQYASNMADKYLVDEKYQNANTIYDREIEAIDKMGLSKEDRITAVKNAVQKRNTKIEQDKAKNLALMNSDDWGDKAFGALNYVKDYTQYDMADDTLGALGTITDLAHKATGVDDYKVSKTASEASGELGKGFDNVLKAYNNIFTDDKAEKIEDIDWSKFGEIVENPSAAIELGSNALASYLAMKKLGFGKMMGSEMASSVQSTNENDKRNGIVKTQADLAKSYGVSAAMAGVDTLTDKLLIGGGKVVKGVKGLKRATEGAKETVKATTKSKRSLSDALLNKGVVAGQAGKGIRAGAYTVVGKTGKAVGAVAGKSIGAVPDGIGKKIAKGVALTASDMTTEGLQETVPEIYSEYLNQKQVGLIDKFDYTQVMNNAGKGFKKRMQEQFGMAALTSAHQPGASIVGARVKPVTAESEHAKEYQNKLDKIKSKDFENEESETWNKFKEENKNKEAQYKAEVQKNYESDIKTANNDLASAQEEFKQAKDKKEQKAATANIKKAKKDQINATKMRDRALNETPLNMNAFGKYVQDNHDELINVDEKGRYIGNNEEKLQELMNNAENSDDKMFYSDHLNNAREFNAKSDETFTETSNRMDGKKKEILDVLRSEQDIYNSGSKRMQKLAKKHGIKLPSLEGHKTEFRNKSNKTIFKEQTDFKSSTSDKLFMEKNFEYFADQKDKINKSDLEPQDKQEALNELEMKLYKKAKESGRKVDTVQFMDRVEEALTRMNTPEKKEETIELPPNLVSGKNIEEVYEKNIDTLLKHYNTGDKDKDFDTIFKVMGHLFNGNKDLMNKGMYRFIEERKDDKEPEVPKFSWKANQDRMAKEAEEKAKEAEAKKEPQASKEDKPKETAKETAKPSKETAKNTDSEDEQQYEKATAEEAMSDEEFQALDNEVKANDLKVALEKTGDGLTSDHIDKMIDIISSKDDPEEYLNELFDDREDDLRLIIEASIEESTSTVGSRGSGPEDFEGSLGSDLNAGVSLINRLEKLDKITLGGEYVKGEIPDSDRVNALKIAKSKLMKKFFEEIVAIKDEGLLDTHVVSALATNSKMTRLFNQINQLNHLSGLKLEALETIKKEGSYPVILRTINSAKKPHIIEILNEGFLEGLMLKVREETKDFNEANKQAEEAYEALNGLWVKIETDGVANKAIKLSKLSSTAEIIHKGDKDFDKLSKKNKVDRATSNSTSDSTSNQGGSQQGFAYIGSGVSYNSLDKDLKDLISKEKSKDTNMPTYIAAEKAVKKLEKSLKYKKANKDNKANKEKKSIQVKIDSIKEYINSIPDQVKKSEKDVWNMQSYMNNLVTDTRPVGYQNTNIIYTREGKQGLKQFFDDLASATDSDKIKWKEQADEIYEKDFSKEASYNRIKALKSKGKEKVLPVQKMFMINYISSKSESRDNTSNDITDWVTTNNVDGNFKQLFNGKIIKTTSINQKIIDNNKEFKGQTTNLKLDMSKGILPMAKSLMNYAVKTLGIHRNDAYINDEVEFINEKLSKILEDRNDIESKEDDIIALLTRKSYLLASSNSRLKYTTKSDIVKGYRKSLNSKIFGLNQNFENNKKIKTKFKKNKIKNSQLKGKTFSELEDLLIETFENLDNTKEYSEALALNKTADKVINKMFETTLPYGTKEDSIIDTLNNIAAVISANKDTSKADKLNEMKKEYDSQKTEAEKTIWRKKHGRKYLKLKEIVKEESKNGKPVFTDYYTDLLYDKNSDSHKVAQELIDSGLEYSQIVELISNSLEENLPDEIKRNIEIKKQIEKLQEDLPKKKKSDTTKTKTNFNYKPSGKSNYSKTKPKPKPKPKKTTAKADLDTNITNDQIAALKLKYINFSGGEQVAQEIQAQLEPLIYAMKHYSAMEQKQTERPDVNTLSDEKVNAMFKVISGNKDINIFKAPKGGSDQLVEDFNSMLDGKVSIGNLTPETSEFLNNVSETSGGNKLLVPILNFFISNFNNAADFSKSNNIQTKDNLNLILDNKGNMAEVVKRATTLATMSFINKNRGVLSNPTMTEVKKMYGLNDKEHLSVANFDAVKDLGMPINSLIHEVYTETIRMLDPEFDNEQVRDQFQKAIMSASRIAVANLANTGLLVENDMSLENYNKVFSKIKTAFAATENVAEMTPQQKAKYDQAKVLTVRLKQNGLAKRATNLIMDSFSETNSDGARVINTLSNFGRNIAPITDINRADNISDTMDMTYTKINDETMETLKEWSRRPHHISDFGMNAKDELLKIAEGYDTLEDGHEMSLLQQEAKNQEIQQNLDNHNEFKAQVEDGVPFYFMWKMARNFRAMINSLVTPQGNKMHRGIYSQDNDKIDFVKGDSKANTSFKGGIIQALGKDIPSKKADIDELFTKMNGEFGRLAKMIYFDKIPKGELMDKFKEVTKEDKTLTYKALYELGKYNATEKGKKITTTLLVEADATNSALAHTLMMYPVTSNIKGRLKSIGIEIDTKIGTKMSEEEAKKVLDGYQDFGVNVFLGLDDNSGLKRLLTAFYGEEFFALDENGKPSRALRSLSKFPLMTFLYGSSLGSIQKLIIDDIEEQMFDKITEAINNKDKKTEAKIKAIIGWKGDIRKAVISDRLKKQLVSELGGVSEYFSENYGSVINAKKAENKLYNVMFDIFKPRFEKALNEAVEAFNEKHNTKHTDIYYLPKDAKESIMQELFNNPSIPYPSFNVNGQRIPAFKFTKKNDQSNVQEVYINKGGATVTTVVRPVATSGEAFYSGATVFFTHASEAHMVLDIPQNMQIYDAVLSNIVTYANTPLEMNNRMQGIANSKTTQIDSTLNSFMNFFDHYEDDLSNKEKEILKNIELEVIKDTNLEFTDEDGNKKIMTDPTNGVISQNRDKNVAKGLKNILIIMGLYKELVDTARAKTPMKVTSNFQDANDFGKKTAKVMDFEATREDGQSVKDFIVKVDKALNEINPDDDPQDDTKGKTRGSGPNSSKYASDNKKKRLKYEINSDNSNSLTPSELLSVLEREDVISDIVLDTDHNKELNDVINNILDKTKLLRNIKLKVYNQSKNSNDEAVYHGGKIDNGNSIKLYKQSNVNVPNGGSMKEIYAHELLHPIGELVRFDFELEKQLEALYKRTKESTDYTIFLSNHSDPSNLEIQFAKDTWNYVFGTDSKMSKDDRLNEFFVYGLTNKYIIRATKDLKVDPKDDTNTDTTFGKLKWLMKKALSIFVPQMEGMNAHEQLKVIAKKIAKVDKTIVDPIVKFHDWEKELYNKYNIESVGFMNKQATKMFRKYYKAFPPELESMKEQLMETNPLMNMFNAVKNTASTITASTFLMLEDSKGFRDKIVIGASKISPELSKYLKVVMGTPTKFKGMSTLVNKSKAMIEQAGVQSEAKYVHMLNNLMKDLEPHEKENLNKLFVETDIFAIDGKNSIKANHLIHYMGNSIHSTIDETIEDMEKQLIELDNNSDKDNSSSELVVRYAQKMGKNMITGTEKGINFSNVFQLYDTMSNVEDPEMLFEEPLNLSGRALIDVDNWMHYTDVLNRLVSLQALKALKSNEKLRVSLFDTLNKLGEAKVDELMVHVRNGIIGYKKAVYPLNLDEDDFSDLAKAKRKIGYNRKMETKGTFPTKYGKQYEYREINKKELTMYENEGWLKQMDTSDNTIIVIRDRYTIGSELKQGFSFYKANKGTYSSFDLNKKLPTKSDISDEITKESKLRDQFSAIKDALIFEADNPTLSRSVMPMPIFSFQEGINLNQYVYRPDPTFEKVKQNKVTSIDKVIGSMFKEANNQVNSKLINMKIYNYLDKLAQEDFIKNAKKVDDEWENPEYIVLSRTQNKEKYFKLPKYMRDEMDRNEDIRLLGKFVIPVLLADEVLGVKVPTTLEVAESIPFLGSKLSDFMKDHQLAKHRILKFEKYFADLHAMNKEKEVLKTPDTWVGNILSNITYLTARNFTVEEIFKGFTDGAKEIEHYHKLNKEFFKLKIKLDANSITDDEKARYDELDYELKSNTIAWMFKAGAYESLQDDLMDADYEISNNRLKDLIADYRDKIASGSNVGNIMMEILKHVYMSEDTLGGKLSQMALQNGDFLGKLLVFNKGLRAIENDPKMKSKDDIENEKLIVLTEIMDDFINYNKVLPRHLEWLNKTAVAVYMKFMLGIPKTILKTTITSPLNIIKFLTVEELSGHDMESFDDTFKKNFLENRYRNLGEAATNVIVPVWYDILKKLT